MGVLSYLEVHIANRSGHGSMSQSLTGPTGYGSMRELPTNSQEFGAETALAGPAGMGYHCTRLLSIARGGFAPPPQALPSYSQMVQGSPYLSLKQGDERFFG